MSELIKLNCPSCGARIKVKEGSNRFSCDYCGNEHMLSATAASAATAATAASAAAAAPPVIRPRQPIPGSVRIEQDERGARIIQRWFSAQYVFMAFFAVFWDGFLIIWYSVTLGGGAPLFFSLFPVIHLAIGVYITYSTLAGFFNRTTVELTGETLSIYFDPLPWPGEKTLQRANIKQLYCKEHVRRTKNGVRHSYQLFAVTQDDTAIKLLGKVDDPQMAQFFEQRLESWLSITDQPVEGEFR